ncbi:MAG: glycosyltransferase family 39 protein [Oligoflexia bacterium]|nr:glycosyltransferase family 39 protein [Oligoflexia bacterium]
MLNREKNRDRDRGLLKISYLLVFLTAIVLLYQHLWVRGFFHDGHLYAALGKNAVLYNRWIAPYLSEINYPLFNQHPPLLFIMEGIFFKIFGISWVSARFFSVSCAFVSIVLLTYFVGQSGNRVFAFYSGLIFSLLPPLFKKARSPSLDITLMMLVLFSLFFYFQAYKNYFDRDRDRDRWKWPLYWLLAGTFLGFALLEKGPPALIIPMTVVVHLLLTGKISMLFKNAMPWVSLALGAALFCLWPALLYLEGREIIFWDYVNNQLFSTIVQGRGQKDFMLSIYPYYLLENMGPWSIMGIIGVIFIIRDFILKKARYRFDDRFKSVVILFASLFFVVVVFFSFVRWKYSNYIVPSFPALAVLAAYPMTKLGERFHRGFIFVHKRLLVVLVLLLLIFPITTTTTRDVELFKIIDVLDSSALYSNSHSNSHSNSEKKLINWKIVNSIYPYYNVVNLISWEGFGEVNVLGITELETYIDEQKKSQQIVILIDRESYNLLKIKYGDILNKIFVKLLEFRDKNMVVLATHAIFEKLKSN